MQSSVNNWNGSLFDTPRERDRRLKMLRRELTPEQLQRYNELENKRTSKNLLAALAAMAGVSALGVGGGIIGDNIGKRKMGSVRDAAIMDMERQGFDSDFFKRGRERRGDAVAQDARSNARAVGAVVGVAAGTLGIGAWLAIRSFLKNKARNQAALRKYKRGDLAKYLDNSKGWSPWSVKDEAEIDELTRAITPMYYDDPSTAK